MTQVSSIIAQQDHQIIVGGSDVYDGVSDIVLIRVNTTAGEKPQPVNLLMIRRTQVFHTV